MKLKSAKIDIHKNQIQMISGHEIYNLDFLKERLHVGEMREPTITCSVNEYLERI